MPERIIGLSQEVSELARKSVDGIQRVTSRTKMLAINALIEAAHAGDAGRGFAVVAKDVGEVSEQINRIAESLGEQLTCRATELDTLGKGLVANIRGQRLTDLALNMIEIIDRNLYERSCDVRWWKSSSITYIVPKLGAFAPSRADCPEIASVCDTPDVLPAVRSISWMARSSLARCWAASGAASSICEARCRVAAS